MSRAKQMTTHSSSQNSLQAFPCSTGKLWLGAFVGCALFVFLNLSSATHAVPLEVSGNDSPVVGQNNIYTFTPDSRAIGYSYRSSRRGVYNWVEGAENGFNGFTYQAPRNNIGTAETIISDLVYPNAGFRSFHLSQRGADDVWLVSRDVRIPASGATTLTFQSRMRTIGPAQAGRVQVSTDRGVTWPHEIFRQGQAGILGESEFRDIAPISLNSFANREVRIRFILGSVTIGSSYTGVSDQFGWFFDKIRIQTAGQPPLLFDDADNSFVNMTPSLQAYASDFISATVYAESHPHSFHLSHGSGGDSWLELDRVLVPRIGSRLQFKSRLRYASTSQSGRVLISIDDGRTWPYEIFKQSGNGTLGETVFRDVPPISLDAFAGQSIRIRFAYVFSSTEGSGSRYSSSADEFGWFFDDIAVTSAEELINASIGTASNALTFAFTPPEAGPYALQVQPIGQDQVPMAWGPVKSVTAAAGSGTPNTAPTISTIPNQSTNEDVTTTSIPFSVNDAETAAGSLNVAATSSDTALVPNANIILAGSGTNRTLTVTPAANKWGTCTITLTVSDGSLAASKSFALTVNAVNDPPVAQDGTLTMSAIGDGSGALVATDVEDGPALDLSVVDQPRNGTVTITDGAFSYIPSSVQTLHDSFKFAAVDSGQMSDVATITVSLPDSDEDGLPDIWETALGTDATSASSFFRVTPGTSDGAFTLTWPSVPGKTYNVECAADLGSTWSTAATVMAVNDTTTWIDTASHNVPHLFYRVAVVFN